jgi:hypothetical protein
MPPATEDAQTAQFTACVPDNPGVCYRIAGKEQVEKSADGGSTWQVDWKMPPGRRQYMGKNPAITPFFRIEPDTVPYDLGIISGENEHTVIVTMGNQGVLVKSPDGNWDRFAVSPAESNRLAFPLPFYATSFNDVIQALRTETTWTLLVAFIFFVLLSYIGWRKLYFHTDGNSRSKVLWSSAPFILAIMGFSCLIFLIVVDLFAPLFLDLPDGFSLLDFSSNLSLVICLIPIIGLIISWLLIAVTSSNRKTGFLTAAVTLGYTLVFIAGILIPFGLWAFGIIPKYEIALAVRAVFSLLSLYFGYRHVRRLAALAARQENLPMQQNSHNVTCNRQEQAVLK